MGAFKSIITVDYIRGVRSRSWWPFDRRLWQRNYYERVVRDEREAGLIRRYVEENPLRWHLDRYHPDRNR